MIPGAASALGNHVWGVSRAQDRIWSQVSAIAPSKKPRERVFVVLQSFMDESYTENGVFVLAGYISTAESWASFSKEWEELLPTALRKKDGTYRFKMREMATVLDRVPPFYRVIEKHALMSVSCMIDLSELNRAKERIWVPGRHFEWGYINDPYQYCFYQFLTSFHYKRLDGSLREPLKQILSNQKVYFYFDTLTSKKAIYNAWDRYASALPAEMRALYGMEPRFEDDEQFLPLQGCGLLGVVG
jgi:hypothetical protein